MIEKLETEHIDELLHKFANACAWGTREDRVKHADSITSILSERDAEIERERAARKTEQESLEQYKGECTRLQHEVDRLTGCAERA